MNLTAQSGSCGVVPCSQEEQHISLKFGQRTIKTAMPETYPSPLGSRQSSGDIPEL